MCDTPTSHTHLAPGLSLYLVSLSLCRVKLEILGGKVSKAAKGST